MLSMSLFWHAPDRSELLNLRLKDVSQKGFVVGGTVTPVPLVLQVTVSPFTCVTYDGAVVRSDVTETLTVTSGVVNYLVLRAVYVLNNSPTLALQVLSAAAFAGDPDPNHLHVIATIDLTPGPFTSVALSQIHYELRDAIDQQRRVPWRDPVATFASLPTPPADTNRHGDVRLVLDTGSFYWWDDVGNIWNLMDEVPLQIHRDQEHSNGITGDSSTTTLQPSTLGASVVVAPVPVGSFYTVDGMLLSVPGGTTTLPAIDFPTAGTGTTRSMLQVSANSSGVVALSYRITKDADPLDLGMVRIVRISDNHSVGTFTLLYAPVSVTTGNLSWGGGLPVLVTTPGTFRLGAPSGTEWIEVDILGALPAFPGPNVSDNYTTSAIAKNEGNFLIANYFWDGGTGPTLILGEDKRVFGNLDFAQLSDDYKLQRVYPPIDDLRGDMVYSGGTCTSAGGLNLRVIGPIVTYINGRRYEAAGNYNPGIVLADNILNYVYVNSSGVLTSSTTNPATLSAAFATVAEVTTSGGVITLITDTRDPNIIVGAATRNARVYFTATAAAKWDNVNTKLAVEQGGTTTGVKLGSGTVYADQNTFEATSGALLLKDTNTGSNPVRITTSTEFALDPLQYGSLSANTSIVGALTARQINAQYVRGVEVGLEVTDGGGLNASVAPGFIHDAAGRRVELPSTLNMPLAANSTMYLVWDPRGQGAALAGQSGVAASTTAVSGNLVTVTGLTGMTTKSVGRVLTFTGFSNANNNGTFLIAQFISATSVKIVNPFGFAPNTPGSWSEHEAGTFRAISSAASPGVQSYQEPFAVVRTGAIAIATIENIQRRAIGIQDPNIVTVGDIDGAQTLMSNFATLRKALLWLSCFQGPGTRPANTIAFTREVHTEPSVDGGGFAIRLDAGALPIWAGALYLRGLRFTSLTGKTFLVWGSGTTDGLIDIHTQTSFINDWIFSDINFTYAGNPSVLDSTTVLQDMGTSLQTERCSVTGSVHFDTRTSVATDFGNVRHEGLTATTTGAVVFVSAAAITVLGKLVVEASSFSSCLGLISGPTGTLADSSGLEILCRNTSIQDVNPIWHRLDKAKLSFDVCTFGGSGYQFNDLWEAQISQPGASLTDCLIAGTVNMTGTRLVRNCRNYFPNSVAVTSAATTQWVNCSIGDGVGSATLSGAFQSIDNCVFTLDSTLLVVGFNRSITSSRLTKSIGSPTMVSISASSRSLAMSDTTLTSSPTGSFSLPVVDVSGADVVVKATNVAIVASGADTGYSVSYLGTNSHLTIIGGSVTTAKTAVLAAKPGGLAGDLTSVTVQNVSINVTDSAAVAVDSTGGIQKFRIDNCNIQTAKDVWLITESIYVDISNNLVVITGTAAGSALVGVLVPTALTAGQLSAVCSGNTVDVLSGGGCELGVYSYRTTTIVGNRLSASVPTNTDGVVHLFCQNDENAHANFGSAVLSSNTIQIFGVDSGGPANTVTALLRAEGIAHTLPSAIISSNSIIARMFNSAVSGIALARITKVTGAALSGITALSVTGNTVHADAFAPEASIIGPGGNSIATGNVIFESGGANAGAFAGFSTTLNEVG